LGILVTIILPKKNCYIFNLLILKNKNRFLRVNSKEVLIIVNASTGNNSCDWRRLRDPDQDPANDGRNDSFTRLVQAGQRVQIGQWG
jgi:hypothetical protein